VVTNLDKTKNSVSIGLLKGDSSEMVELQRVLEEAPKFAYRVTRCPPQPADAQSTYSALPDGKTYNDKFVYGIFCDDKMVGCIDVIRDYPKNGVAWIGLLLVSEKLHGQGIGRKALELLKREIYSWKACKGIQLAVVSTNDVALPFWRKMGFCETGKRTPYRYNQVEAESIHMEYFF
jgi:GNAT superfamily N-acetyltransferase